MTDETPNPDQPEQADTDRPLFDIETDDLIQELTRRHSACIIQGCREARRVGNKDVPLQVQRAYSGNIMLCVAMALSSFLDTLTIFRTRELTSNDEDGDDDNGSKIL